MLNSGWTQDRLIVDAKFLSVFDTRKKLYLLILGKYPCRYGYRCYKKHRNCLHFTHLKTQNDVFLLHPFCNS